MVYFLLFFHLLAGVFQNDKLFFISWVYLVILKLDSNKCKILKWQVASFEKDVGADPRTVIVHSCINLPNHWIAVTSVYK